jgi:hypothetical protein
MAQDCHGSDFVFPVPDDWVERSMVGFSAPVTPGSPITPNTLVATNQIPEGEALDAFVTRQVDDLRARASGFVLKLRRDARLDGVPCVEIVFTWQGGEAGIIQQRQVYVARPGGRVISITNTAPEADFAAHDADFLETLSHFAWKKAGQAAAAA